MEALCDLLFELSNDDRLSILFELEKGPLKLSNISKVLDFTPQATSRNLTRLVEIGLIRRNDASDYILTPYGASSLKQLESFIFLSENKEYMSAHWTDKLPSEFQARLGELRNCERIDDPLDLISNMERIFGETEVWFRYMTPVRFASHNSLKFAIDLLDAGATIRGLEPMGYEPSAKALALTPIKDLEDMKAHWVKGNLEYRYLDEINLKVYMSEKEVSLLAFPKIDGEVDMFGFTSPDPKFHRWCSDLFDYYWARSKTEPTSWLLKALEKNAK
jgi:predicted transcriptional regulator